MRIAEIYIYIYKYIIIVYNMYICNVHIEQHYNSTYNHKLFNSFQTPRIPSLISPKIL